MKNKGKKLFEDQDVVIQIEDIQKKMDSFIFWTHPSERANKKKKVQAIILSKKMRLAKNSKSLSMMIPSTKSSDRIEEFIISNAEYVKSEDSKNRINLIFRNKLNTKEKFLKEVIRMRDNIFQIPVKIRNLFNRLKEVSLRTLLQVNQKERLIALGRFWSTPIGKFLFSASANIAGDIFIIPLLVTRRRYYLVDIPNIERLGHAVANTDVIQAEFIRGMYKTAKEDRELIVFYPKISLIEDVGHVYFSKIAFIQQIINSKVRKVARILYLHPWVEKVVKRALKKTGSSFIHVKPYGHRDIFNVINVTPPFFAMTAKDEASCIKYFEEKNFRLDRPLILCGCRAAGNINFKNSRSKSVNEEKRYGYRNSSFRDMIPSIQTLISKGYNVIKVGGRGGVGSASDFGEHFFDYSEQPEADKTLLLDLFLFSRCLFYLGDTSGNYSLAQAFRKPICFINFAPLGHFHSWDNKSISIFKNMKNRKTGKLLGYKSITKYQYGYEIHNEKNNSNLKYIANTKKEISETVKEMEARISGVHYDADEKLQAHFQKLFAPSYLHQSVNARCGDYFLKKYEHLLRK